MGIFSWLLRPTTVQQEEQAEDAPVQPWADAVRTALSYAAGGWVGVWSIDHTIYFIWESDDGQFWMSSNLDCSHPIPVQVDGKSLVLPDGYIVWHEHGESLVVRGNKARRIEMYPLWKRGA